MTTFEKESTPETGITRLSQETFAEMIGTTRSRVSFFMNRLCRLGHIDYYTEIRVRSSLCNVHLHDSFLQKSRKDRRPWIAWHGRRRRQPYALLNACKLYGIDQTANRFWRIL